MYHCTLFLQWNLLFYFSFRFLRHSFFFRSMILLSCSVLFTSRAILAFQKSNVLSGITGDLIWTLHHLILSFHLYISIDVFWLSYSAISTVHAIFITVLSLYLVFWSDLYSDYRLAGLVTLRTSPLSTFALGVRMHNLF